MVKQDARTSLCWNCKFGVCTKEIVIENRFQPGERENPFSESPPSEEEIVEVKVENVKTVCFWRPQGVNEAPPILMSYVKDCNRHANH